MLQRKREAEKRREKQKLLFNTPTALAIWTRPKCVVSTGPGRLLENDAEQNRTAGDFEIYPQ